MVIPGSIAERREHVDREEQLAVTASAGSLSGEAESHGDGGLSAGSHALLLHGCERAASRDEVLAALPFKGAVDRYVARYFNFEELISGKWLYNFPVRQDRLDVFATVLPG